MFLERSLFSLTHCKAPLTPQQQEEQQWRLRQALGEMRVPLAAVDLFNMAAEDDEPGVVTLSQMAWPKHSLDRDAREADCVFLSFSRTARQGMALSVIMPD